jgi:iron complex transport system substrate-binding protein
VVFLEWIDPPFNGGHWNPHLIELAGGVDLIGEAGRPSRTLAWEEVVATRPDVLFIASCGFSSERAMEDIPILKRQPGWLDLPAVRSGRVYLTDGNAYFSRPGPRLVESLEILAHALHPRVHPEPNGIQPALTVAT